MLAGAFCVVRENVRAVSFVRGVSNFYGLHGLPLLD
jgi:hypothetical protein